MNDTYKKQVALLIKIAPLLSDTPTIIISRLINNDNCSDFLRIISQNT